MNQYYFCELVGKEVLEDRIDNHGFHCHSNLPYLASLPPSIFAISQSLIENCYVSFWNFVGGVIRN